MAAAARNCHHVAAAEVSLWHLARLGMVGTSLPEELLETICRYLIPEGPPRFGDVILLYDTQCFIAGIATDGKNVYAALRDPYHVVVISLTGKLVATIDMGGSIKEVCASETLPGKAFVNLADGRLLVVGQSTRSELVTSRGAKFGLSVVHGLPALTWRCVDSPGCLRVLNVDTEQNYSIDLPLEGRLVAAKLPDVEELSLFVLDNNNSSIVEYRSAIPSKPVAYRSWLKGYIPLVAHIGATTLPNGSFILLLSIADSVIFFDPSTGEAAAVCSVLFERQRLAVSKRFLLCAGANGTVVYGRSILVNPLDGATRPLR